MLSKYLKNTAVFSAVTAVIFGVLVSCDNPFSNSLGSKVDVEPPTISVESPVSGAYIKGTARFTGRAGAYRELRRIEVKIFNPDETQPPLLDWTPLNAANIHGDSKNQTWFFDLDTLNPDFLDQGLDDGFLKIQFRVRDSNLDSKMNTRETVELVYIIKNKPSVVKMTNPDSSKLGDEFNLPKVGTNMEIRGQIIDRRGIKPGYPRIKLWPEDMQEPSGNDPDWGWATLFLSSIDDPDRDGGYYADRNEKPVERVANFVFRLSKFTIDPATRKVKYDLSSGDYQPLDSGRYRFRIITSDTFFDSDPNSKKYLYPRAPEGDETEAIGYYPLLDENTDYPDLLNSGPSFAVQLISSGVRPIIELDNSDKANDVLEATPNEFITESTTKKIKNFRLRVLATHQSELIEQAVLEWEHPGTGRSGKLAWSAFDTGDLGYTDANDPSAGHNGQWKNPASPLEGKYFVFNGDSGLTYNDGTGEHKIFTSSSEPYTLLITVFSQSDLSTLQKYTLYVDGDGPAVSIRTVRGAYAEPSDDEDYYTVNGNIQVSVDHSAGMGIMTANGAPVVKWVVEEKPGDANDTGTLLGKIEAFRNNPTASGLKFFDAIGETPVSGWVQPGEVSTLKFNTRKEDTNGFNLWNGEYLYLYVIAEDNIQNLNYTVQKLKVDDNTDIPSMDVGGKDFVSTKDGIDKMEKLLITYDSHGNKVGNTDKNNILDNNQGIELSFTDDDGISLSRNGVEITLKDLNSGVEKRLSAALIRKAVSGKDYLETGNSLEWLGVLSQEIMAEALYGGENPPKNLSDGFYWLKIKVTDNDRVKVAIESRPGGSLPGDTPVSASKEQEFFFAVQSQMPVITVIGIEENATKNKKDVLIEGTVKSRVKIQKLSITFNPVIDPAKLPSVKPNGSGGTTIETETLESGKGEIILSAGEWSDKEKTWVYDWKMPYEVNFGPDNLFDSTIPDKSPLRFDWRRFNLQAFDSLDSAGVLERTVQVDTTSPDVALNETLFNFGRLPDEMTGKYDLNGKVPVVITATDLNGIEVEKVENSERDLVETGNANVWWWVLPVVPGNTNTPTASLGEDGFTVTVTPFPGGGDAGLGGQFKTSDNIGGGNYRVYLDTTKLTDGDTYKIWAIAQDKSGNFNVIDPAKPLRTFTVNQETDYPKLVKDSLLPLDEDVIQGTGSLSISGKAFDDDGFDKTKLGNYVEIRFNKGVNEWTGWFPMTTVTGPDAAGEISFKLDLTAAISPDSTLYDGYFATEGAKRYQIRITDEAAASSDGTNNPPGKNPDGINTIQAARRIYPRTDEAHPDPDKRYYSFYLKTKPPEIFFGEHDPNSAHPNYINKRPVYKTVDQLLAALVWKKVGNTETGAWVVDGYLDKVYFSYNLPSDTDQWTKPEPGSETASNSIKNYVLVDAAITSPSEGKYIWNNSATWIPAGATAAWLQPFALLKNDGMQSVTIEAVDRAGMRTRVEYSFNRDTSAPAINFTNVNESIIPAEWRVVSGTAGNVSVRGAFRDDYSNIEELYYYKFDNAPVFESASTFGSGVESSASANWEIKIPGKSFDDPDFRDGPHKLTIKVADVLKNQSEEKTVFFIVDRSSPEISKQDTILVMPGKEGNQSRVIDEAKRVFSADGYDNPSVAGEAAFKLSGLVYEHNISRLSAGIFANSADANAKLTVNLENIDQHNFTATPVYTSGNFSIKRAESSDIRVLDSSLDASDALKQIAAMQNNREQAVYVWTLAITKGDLATLWTADGTETTRRQIILVATDLAGKNSSRETWRFFLDGTKPDIKFFNLISGPPLITVLSSPAINLNGTVEDSTNVNEIKYRVAKYDYAASALANADVWLYYNAAASGAAAWTATFNDPMSNWPDLLPPGTVKTSVTWALNNTTLNKYPANLFNEEGRYKLELHATDHSLNDELESAGNAEDLTRLFFIDRTSPAITSITERKPYYSATDYNGASIPIEFEYTVTDANGIADVSAVISPAAGGLTLNPSTYDPRVTNPGKITVTINMGGATSGQYSLTLTATDGAGQTVTDKIDFNLDNTKPDITAPAEYFKNAADPGKDTTLTGRVKINGKFDKPNNLSPVDRVAFYVTHSGNGYAAPSMPTKDNLEANGWHYNTGAVGPWKLEVNNKSLVEIEMGTASAVITMPNIRYFLGTNYLGPIHKVTAADVTAKKYIYNATVIPMDEEIYPVTIYLFAIDQAGNREMKSFEYLIYPEGDRPQVTAINSPKQNVIDTEKMMNGRIRISGTAEDNVYVKHVWFRVLKDPKETGGVKVYADNLQIPIWDETTWEPKKAEDGGGIQGKGVELKDEKGDSLGTNWYMANGGGSSTVSWWAYINTEGELDPILSNSATITIEVLAEDSTQLDSGGWDTDIGLITKYKNRQESQAIVVSGAPRFEDELVLNAESSTQTDWTKWGNIITTSMRGRSAYATHVKHTWGIGSITWEGHNLLDPTDPYVAATYNEHIAAMTGSGGTYNAATNPGIAVKAQPKQLLTDSVLRTVDTTKDRTFMLWVPFGSYNAALLGGYFTETENKQSTTFTLKANTTITITDSAVRLMEMNNDYFEWIVVVDIHADILDNGAHKGKAIYYTKLEISAEETSKVIPLKSTAHPPLPIDNVPPTGLYTHNTNVAGSAATFGGEASDTGDVKGLSRVVLWFSRKTGSTETYISWEELNSKTFQSGGTVNRNNSDIQNLPADGSNITLPLGFDETNATATANWSSIVIDRNDPSGFSTHHGHNKRMGFATVGSATSWYVVLDSTKITSGPVTAHYIVYDRAGNASYYSDKLMVLNNVPKISRIKLGTDIRRDTGLQTQAVMGTGGTNNLTFRSTDASGALDRIRKAFTDNSAVTGVTADSPDSAMGISDVIAIDTSVVNTLGAVYDNAFSVRNGLLALRVEIDQPYTSSKNRYFRVEYVDNATLRSGNNFYKNITAGKAYIIENPGNIGGTGNRFPWGRFGAKGTGVQSDVYTRGQVFLAMENGTEVNLPYTQNEYGNPSVWELNSSAVPAAAQIGDVGYTTANAAAGYAMNAEFVFRSNAFGTTAIRDFDPLVNANPNLSDLTADGRPKAYPFPSFINNTGTNPTTRHSLFIVRVFDSDPGQGVADNLFGDFALLSIKVNNDDKTLPYAQLYDLNPLTEGTDRNQSQAAALRPQNIGSNRLRGGLWNTTGRQSDIAKSGHIEPRSDTSLISSEMGGAASESAETIIRPFARSAAYFAVDTVSGQVIVRGYAEDDQRVFRVELQFSGTGITTSTQRILECKTPLGTMPAAPASGDPLPNFMLQSAQGANVSFVETVDLNRHRVEWAYLWDSQTIPADTVVGDITVKAVAYNAPVGYTATSNPKNPSPDLLPSNQNQAAIYSYYNPTFPASTSARTYLRYNQMRVNIRPYITGFLRNQANFSHDIRSRQGRYMFYREETAVVSGFNLGGAGTTNITLPGMGSVTAAAVTDANIVNYGVTAANNNAARYRQFTVGANAATADAARGNGLVTLTVSRGTPAVAYSAVNTDDYRQEKYGTGNAYIRPRVIQPWNVERNPGKDGSTLWDDFTLVHIWQSNDTAPANNTDAGRFASADNWIMLSPAMSIDPRNGTLYASYNQGGRNNAANNGNTYISANGTTTVVASFLDPILFSDIYYSPGDGSANADSGASYWSAYSIIGRAGTYQAWKNLGGLYMSGPNGADARLDSGAGLANQYLAESTYYNASSNGPGTVHTPPTTDQFMNPHIITSRSNNQEHIHVSYYDTKDGSIKYRYNRRGTAGTVSFWGVNNDNGDQAGTRAPYAWTNLDGGFDADDLVQMTGTNPNTNAGVTAAGNGNLEPPFTAGAANGRVVNYATRNAAATLPNVGKHNAIAVTSNGYPVVVYFDETNQKLKMAVSNSTTPFAAENWRIIEDVIPTGNTISKETGQFVSMRIDTRATGAEQNRIHIAALNLTNKSLVYISGFANFNTGTPSTFTGTRGGTDAPVVQVVDSVGNVGRWCAISLDSGGNPWISYMDEGYLGARDGVKVAYKNTAQFYKGGDAAHFNGQDRDANNTSITGWEAMHVPTRFRVDNLVEGPGREHGRLGMECWPTRNYTGTPAPQRPNGVTDFWSAAVSYLSQDAETGGAVNNRYRVAYYVK
jgi:hypothetical protein